MLATTFRVFGISRISESFLYRISGSFLYRIILYKNDFLGEGKITVFIAIHIKFTLVSHQMDKMLARKMFSTKQEKVTWQLRWSSSLEELSLLQRTLVREAQFPRID